MQMTLCDMCPNDLSLVPAEFHLDFTRVKDGSCADWAVDLCKRHYEEIYDFIQKEKRTAVFDGVAARGKHA
jgi:hypothetical protein